MEKSNNLSTFPATAKLIVVNGHFTEFGPSFGVLQGESARFEFELVSRLIISLTMANVSIENRLNLYSNYLDNPQNVDIDYQMHLVMKINKYLSANVALQTIYDDNSIQAVQLSEVFELCELWFLETNKKSLLKVILKFIKRTF
jgi:hypothetical protein